MKVVAAAILDAKNRVVSLPSPNRHHDIIEFMVDSGHQTPILGEQGFILNNGMFVGRIEAMKIAKASEQLLADSPHEELYSEDLW